MYRINDYKNHEPLEIMLHKTKISLLKYNIYRYTFERFYETYKTTIDRTNMAEGCFVVVLLNVEGDFGFDVCLKITDIKPTANGSCTLRLDTIEERGRRVVFTDDDNIYNFDDVLIYEFSHFVEKLTDVYLCKRLGEMREAVKNHYLINTYPPQREIFRYLAKDFHFEKLQHVKHLLDNYTQEIINVTGEAYDTTINRLQSDIARLETQLNDFNTYFECNDILQHWDLWDFTDDQKSKVLAFNDKLKTVLQGLDNNANTLYNLGSLFCNVIKTDAANEVNKAYTDLLFEVISNSVNDRETVFKIVEMFYTAFESVKVFFSGFVSFCEFLNDQQK